MKSQKLFLGLFALSLLTLSINPETKAAYDETRMSSSNGSQSSNSSSPASKHQYKVSRGADANIYVSKTTIITPEGRTETISSTGFYDPRTKVGEFNIVQPDGSISKVIVDRSESNN